MESSQRESDWVESLVIPSAGQDSEVSIGEDIILISKSYFNARLMSDFKMFCGWQKASLWIGSRGLFSAWHCGAQLMYISLLDARASGASFQDFDEKIVFFFDNESVGMDNVLSSS